MSKPLTESKSTNEFNKFSELLGKCVVDVNDLMKTGWASFTKEAPDNVTEVYKFKDSGDVVLRTLTLTYSDTCKEDLIGGVWS